VPSLGCVLDHPGVGGGAGTGRRLVLPERMSLPHWPAAAVTTGESTGLWLSAIRILADEGTRLRFPQLGEAADAGPVK
jgi:hypothetical protein